MSSTSEDADASIDATHASPARKSPHPKKTPSPASSPSVASKKVFICKICRKEFTDLRAAATHLTQNHYIEIELQCPHCAQKWPSSRRAEVQRHGRQAHADLPQPIQYTIVSQSSFFRMKIVVEESGEREEGRAGQEGAPTLRTSPRSGRIIGVQLDGSSNQSDLSSPSRGALPLRTTLHQIVVTRT